MFGGRKTYRRKASRRKASRRKASRRKASHCGGKKTHHRNRKGGQYGKFTQSEYNTILENEGWTTFGDVG